MSTKRKDMNGAEKRVNIFLCHNPFHVYVCNQICSTKFADSRFENLIICSIPTFTRILSLNYLVLKKGLVGRVVSYWRAKMKIVGLSNKYRGEAHFFLPHVGGVLGNYIFESKRLSRNRSRINFYYEGAAMVDNRRKERAIELFVRQKTILSLLIFHRFVVHRDILPMYSTKIHKIYTPYPEKTQAPENKKELINFPIEAIKKGKGGILIVGVDAGDALEEATISLIAFLRKLQSESSGTVFFKPHYADRLKTFEREAKKSGFKYELITDSRCIEEIIGGLEIELIICTHFSSALLNLKLLYRNELKVIFFAHPDALKVLGEEFIDLIRSTGVQITEIVKERTQAS